MPDADPGYRPARTEWWYRLPDDFALPPIAFSGEEATVLLLALASLGAPEHSPLGGAHHLAQEKLLAAMRGEVRQQAQANLQHVQVLADRDGTDQRVIEALRDAAKAGRWVEIDYHGSREATTRAILPELVYLASGRWYVRSVDGLRQAIRTFRVSRIRDVRHLPAPENATAIVAAARLQSDDYHHPGNPQILVRLTKRGGELAKDHPDFRDHLQGDGDNSVIRFRCPESELPYYARELLRFEDEAIVEAPIELRDLMAATVDKLRRHLQKQ